MDTKDWCEELEGTGTAARSWEMQMQSPTCEVNWQDRQLPHCKGAAPTSSLSLQNPTTCQRIIHVSYWPFVSLSPGLWLGLGDSAITAQQFFWALNKLATSVKISCGFRDFVPISPPICKHCCLCPVWWVLKHRYARKGAVTGPFFSLENLKSFCWTVRL